MPWLLPIAMLAASGVKAGMDMDAEQRDTKREAETERYSAWTGMKGPGIRRANTMGTLMEGAASGLGQYQAMERNDIVNSMLKKQMGGDTAGINTWALMNQGNPSGMAGVGGLMDESQRGNWWEASNPMLKRYTNG